MPAIKKRIALVTVLVILGFGVFLYLQPSPSPCREIRAACESQGFRRGKTQTERRAFEEACFDPLIDGQSVGTLKIDQETARACKKHLSKKKNRRGGERESEKEARL